MEVLFTFPSRYSFAIGLIRVFSLTGWSRQIRAGFLVSRVTQDTAMLHFASHTGLSPSMVTFSKVFCSRFAYNVAVLQPQPRLATPLVWAVPRSLATTRGIINLFSLPTGTKMFQFPAFAAHTYVRADSHSDCRVVPFGDPRIKGYLHLIADYRSLSRPSSPVRAKASTVRPKNSLFAFIMIHHTFI